MGHGLLGHFLLRQSLYILCFCTLCSLDGFLPSKPEPPGPKRTSTVSVCFPMWVSSLSLSLHSAVFIVSSSLTRWPRSPLPCRSVASLEPPRLQCLPRLRPHHSHYFFPCSPLISLALYTSNHEAAICSHPGSQGSASIQGLHRPAQRLREAQAGGPRGEDEDGEEEPGPCLERGVCFRSE